jgi:hypothetical protein
MGNYAGHAGVAHGTDADAELPSVLDDILAQPDTGLLTPVDTRAAMIHDDSEPPPWQPLRLPQAVDLPGNAQSRSLAPGSLSGLGASISAHKASSTSGAAGSFEKEDSSAVSMETKPEQELGSSAAEPSRPGPPQRTRRTGAVRMCEAFVQEPESQARASSSGAMQPARSQGGDFFRLLDSQVGVCAHKIPPHVLSQQG